MLSSPTIFGCIYLLFLLLLTYTSTPTPSGLFFCYGTKEDCCVVCTRKIGDRVAVSSSRRGSRRGSRRCSSKVSVIKGKGLGVSAFNHPTSSTTSRTDILTERDTNETPPKDGAWVKSKKQRRTVRAKSVRSNTGHSYSLSKIYYEKKEDTDTKF